MSEESEEIRSLRRDGLRGMRQNGPPDSAKIKKWEPSTEPVDDIPAYLNKILENQAEMREKLDEILRSMS